MIIRLGTDDDIEGVLALQQLNLHSELTEVQRRKGFITTPFTEEQIEDIIDIDGLFVVEVRQKIIAYAFAGTWEYFEQWAIFPFMTGRFPQLNYKTSITTSNSFEYGPVCIDVNYRGKGVLNRLFEEMRLDFVQDYALSYTFINKINAISIRAHEKLGWEIVDEFQFNDNNYIGLVFEMRNAVLK